MDHCFTMTGIGTLGTFFVFCVGLASSGTSFDPQELARQNLRKLALANNEMAFNLHRNLVSKSSMNVFFSPLSISIALGMLFYGTRGDTAKELRKALGYEKEDLSSNLVHVTFYHFLREIVSSTDSSGYVLNVANAVLVDKRFELLERYRNDVTVLYDAVVQNLDFSMKTPEIVEAINSWIRKNTNSKIDKLFDDLSPSTLMVLLNAIYFKGTWKTQFDPKQTTGGIFFNNGLESEGRNVSLMHMTSSFHYDSTDNYQVLELPFSGGKISMLIFLPNKRDGLYSLEESLTPEKLAKIQESLEENKVNVFLPKFKLDFDKELSGEIQALGVNHIFSADGDFYGMSPSTGIFVSGIHHKAVIEVNEEGSEAAAVTGNIVLKMKSPHFRADHPFLFAIVEKSCNAILFMGRVNNL
ncbi:unnamed protein product [Larinioides sclopetarius]|uniref:Serpin domain-containing protein n=1 Tax=Larinioides sclopetarius TaxID=280406 RepID=A0AAV2B8E9_9ARAC